MDEIKVLDHGYVKLQRVDGIDTDVTGAARLSYSKGTKSVSKDQGLINYLMRHRHTSPTEMVGLVFHCKMPIFVARQWVRHRTASLNEYSARYSVLDKEYYVPDIEHIAKQSTNNKQGRDEPFTADETKDIQRIIERISEKTYASYDFLIDIGVARELARMVLPVNFYTQWYWKMDLHNLFHFLKLRLDSHAQYEIRIYAEAIAEIVKDKFPMCWSAFEEYQLNSVTFSAKEVACIKRLNTFAYENKSHPDFSNGEWKEFLKKVS